MVKATKNLITNLKKQKHENKSLLFLDNVKIIKDAIENNSIKIECVLTSLQAPGNVGTLIRTAFASGFEYVFLIDSVNKSNSKLIRSSVGAVFNSKVFSMSRDEFCDFVKKHNLKLICADMNGENIFDFATNDQVGVVVGNEGQGVSDQISALCYKTVKIPMMKGIESLNAGVSGSIIMYQINKF